MIDWRLDNHTFLLVIEAWRTFWPHATKSIVGWSRLSFYIKAAVRLNIHPYLILRACARARHEEGAVTSQHWLSLE